MSLASLAHPVPSAQTTPQPSLKTPEYTRRATQRYYKANREKILQYQRTKHKPTHTSPKKTTPATEVNPNSSFKTPEYTRRAVQRYYRENKEKIRQVKRAYREKNKEAINRRRRENYMANQAQLLQERRVRDQRAKERKGLQGKEVKGNGKKSKKKKKKKKKGNMSEEQVEEEEKEENPKRLTELNDNNMNEKENEKEKEANKNENLHTTRITRRVSV